MKNDYTTYWLFYRWLRMYLGLWKSYEIRRNFLIYLSKNGWGKWCDICGGHILRKDRSVDHIIPQSICYELEMPGLLFDYRNMRVAHAKCNSSRSSETESLPESVRIRLEEMRRKRETPYC